MPFKTDYVDAATFLRHKGVEIFHTYRDNDFDQGPREFEFSWKPDADVNKEGETFRVGDLPAPEECSLEGHPGYLTGVPTDSPAWHELNAQWKHWHEVEEPRRVKAIIRAAIDSGLLTQDGLRPPEGDDREAAIIKMAHDRWHRPGEIEVEDAEVSEGDDNGAYVRACVWVDFAGTPLDKAK